MLIHDAESLRHDRLEAELCGFVAPDLDGDAFAFRGDAGADEDAKLHTWLRSAGIPNIGQGPVLAIKGSQR